MPRQHLALAYGLLVGGGAVLLMISFVDPSTPGYFPTCPFYAITGLDCPGCGALRCLHALIQGDLWQAADYNLMVVLALPYLAGCPVMALYRRVTNTPRWMPPSAIPWSVASLIILWWVARNLSALDWLSSSVTA